MNNDKIVFALSKMIQHYVANDPKTQANYAAYIEHVKPQLTPQVSAVVIPLYEHTCIADLTKLGKSGWMYRNWTIDAIGEDIAKIMDTMPLDLHHDKHYQQVTDFASQHSFVFNL